jgi:uncharacterized protein (TIGR02996 family)
MRTFRRTNGQSAVYWSVLLHEYIPGYTFSNDASGRAEQQHVACASPESAATEVARLLAQKLTEGFVEITDAPWHGGFDSPLRQALERALAENSADLAAHMAYADHLVELGDLRGELVRVQLALEDEKVAADERQELLRREKALLDRWQREWLGPLAGFWIDRLDGADWMDDPTNGPNQFGWRRGWIDVLEFSGCSPHVVAAVQRSQPLLRCLREVRLTSARYDEDRYPFGDLAEIDVFSNVRRFVVGVEGDDQNWVRDAISAADFYTRMPRLEDLHLTNGETPFAEPFPHLRKLTAWHSRDVYDLEALAANASLKNLTHLSCWPRGQSNEMPWQRNPDGGWAYIARTAARALFRSPNLPALRHLTLRNSDIGDEGIGDLIASGLLARLTTLDLAGGRITDVGARRLAECPDVRRLESLNLDENMIGPPGLAVLRVANTSVTAGHQYGPEVLETREYLFSGDCE